jgi:RNA polymerase sigma-70 factor, ECF subfamily
MASRHDGFPAVSGDVENMMEPYSIVRLRAQDHGAFSALIDRQYQPVRRYLARLIGDVEAAADLTQETFLRAYLALPRLTDGSNVAGWLFRIATNLARQHYRRRHLVAWSQLSGQETYELLSHGPEEDVTRRDLMDSALAQLPLDQRSCLLLYAWTGYTCAEIGEIVGKSTAAVRMLLVRARRRFRAVYGQGGDNVDDVDNVDNDGRIGHPGGAAPRGGHTSVRPGRRRGLRCIVPEIGETPKSEEEPHAMEDKRHDCRAFEEDILFYPRGDLSPATFATLTRHLVTCWQCREALLEVQATYRRLQRHLQCAPGGDPGVARSAIMARCEAPAALVAAIPMTKKEAAGRPHTGMETLAALPRSTGYPR